MNHDVIQQPNDIMVCSCSPSVLIKKVKCLYSAALGRVEQTVDGIMLLNYFSKGNQQIPSYILGSM